MIKPLADSNRFAHTMFSHRFGSEKRVIVSIEVGQEEGETFGLFPGVCRQFELMISDHDRIGLAHAEGTRA